MFHKVYMATCTKCAGHERLHVVTAASSPPFHKREIFDRHHATGRIRRRVCASVTHVDRVWTSIAERRSLGVVCEQGHIAVRRAVAVDITHVHSAHLQTKHDPNADNSRVAIVYIPSQSLAATSQSSNSPTF